MDKIVENRRITPFLRWTGSKRWFTKSHIGDFLPCTFERYHEPFLGGGAVFFHLQNMPTNDKTYYLSDSNAELINAYVQLRDNPYVVIALLKDFTNSESEYYKIRSSSPDSLELKAARFIYLNRTSFNGIYRVNSQGIYNVPYGKRPQVDFVTEELLLSVSLNLRGVLLKTQNFENSLSDIQEGDFVFLDPPYTIAHENNGFIEYNQHLFSWEHQEKLRDYVLQLIDRGAQFILTNASHKSIFDLYEGICSIKKLSRSSQVGGRNKTRGMYNELIITNIR